VDYRYSAVYGVSRVFVYGFICRLHSSVQTPEGVLSYSFHHESRNNTLDTVQVHALIT